MTPANTESFDELYKKAKEAEAAENYRLAADKYLEAVFHHPNPWAVHRASALHSYARLFFEDNVECTRKDVKVLKNMFLRREREPSMLLRASATYLLALFERKREHRASDLEQEYLEEAIDLCDRVSIEERGQIVTCISNCSYSATTESVETVGSVIEGIRDKAHQRLRIVRFELLVNAAAEAVRAKDYLLAAEKSLSVVLETPDVWYDTTGRLVHFSNYLAILTEHELFPIPKNQESILQMRIMRNEKEPMLFRAHAALAVGVILYNSDMVEKAAEYFRESIALADSATGDERNRCIEICDKENGTDLNSVGEFLDNVIRAKADYHLRIVRFEILVDAVAEAERVKDHLLAAEKSLSAVLEAPDIWYDFRYMYFETYFAIVYDHELFPVPKKQERILRKMLRNDNEPMLFRSLAALTVASNFYDFDEEKAAEYFRDSIALADTATSDERNRNICYEEDGTLKSVGEILDKISGRASMCLQGLENPVEFSPDIDPEQRLLYSRLGVGGSRCDCCKKSKEELGLMKLKVCARCKLANYCSTECQRTQWHAGHKDECRKKGEIREGDSMRLDALKSRTDLNCTIVEVVRRARSVEEDLAESAGRYTNMTSAAPDAAQSPTVFRNFREGMLKFLDGEQLDAGEGSGERWVVGIDGKQMNVPAKNLFRLRPEK